MTEAVLPRDLAMFNSAMDTMLRATDLPILKRVVVEKGQICRRKTRTEARFVFKDKARTVLINWIAESGKFAGVFPFTSLRWDTSLRKDIGGR